MRSKSYFRGSSQKTSHDFSSPCVCTINTLLVECSMVCRKQNKTVILTKTVMRLLYAPNLRAWRLLWTAPYAVFEKLTRCSQPLNSVWARSIVFLISIGELETFVNVDSIEWVKSSGIYLKFKKIKPYK